MTSESSRASAPAITELSDDALLQAIAVQHDSQAFSQLYERYQHDAFNLALHLTGDRQQAEEAVQNGMVAVWRSASTYRPGNARSWILRVIANASLKTMRGIRRRKEMTTAEIPEKLLQAETPEREAERSELITALRRSLGRLPVLNRQLVALYFVAGYSQEEIGHELALPARTVSYKIDETIKQLRETLTKAGFAAAVPLLGSEGLREVICAGHGAPAALRARVLDSLNQAAEHSQRLAKASSTTFGAAKAAIAVTILAACVAGGWWMSQTQRQAPAQSAQRVQPLQPVVVQAPEKAFQAHWDFSKGPPQDISVIQGGWNWEKDARGDGLMNSNLPDRDIPLCVLFPQRFSAKPFLVSMDVVATRGMHLGIDCLWMREKYLPSYDYLHVLFPIKQESNRFEIYVLGSYSIHRVNGENISIYHWETPFPGDRLGMIVTHWKVKKIDMRELSLEEVTKIDVAHELEGLKAKGAERTEVQGRDLDWDKVLPAYR